jgi:hypothetical protein
MPWRPGPPDRNSKVDVFVIDRSAVAVRLLALRIIEAARQRVRGGASLAAAALKGLLRAPKN